MSLTDRGHRAKCGNGHLATWMNAPFFTTSRGLIFLWGSSPFMCHCGSQYRG